MRNLENRKDDLLPVAFLLENLKEIQILVDEGHDLRSIKPEHAAMIKKEKFIIEFLQLDKVEALKAAEILEMFIDKNPESISVFLHFVRRNFYQTKFVMDYTKNRRVWLRDIRKGFGKIICKERMSIIQFVIEGGANLVALREILLDVIINIDRKVFYQSRERDTSEVRVIEGIKGEVPSSRELSDCLTSLEARYSWCAGRVTGYLATSFTSNILLGYLFYWLDVGTDIYFSYQMFEQYSAFNTTNVESVCKENYQLNNYKGAKEEPLDFCVPGNDTNCLQCLDPTVYLQQGLISAVHILLPYILAVALASSKFSWLSIPVPLISKTYRFFLDVKQAVFMSIEVPLEDEQDEKMMETDQQREEFKKKKLEYKEEKRKNLLVQQKMVQNDKDTLKGQLLESTGESSHQFVMQTLWMFPSLVLMVRDSGEGSSGINLDDLFNTRTFSVLTSFASIGFAFSHIT